MRSIERIQYVPHSRATFEAPLAGNYARYYPDKWLADVESSSPITLVIEELCTASEWRVPWLALSELDQTLYVNEA